MFGCAPKTSELCPQANGLGDKWVDGVHRVMPWHYTTICDLVDHWQTLIAGLIALLAAIITVRVTLNVEQRKVDREIDALRKSLAVELRQLVRRALGAHASLQRVAQNSQGPITARTVESLTQLRAPVIYLANANKIGALGDDAMDVAIVYGLIEAARDSIRLIGSSRDPDDINPAIVAQIASVLLEACKHARSVLPKIRTGVAAHENRDAELIKMIGDVTGD